MASERLTRIVGLVVAGSGGPAVPSRLCRIAAEVTRVSGAGVTIFAEDAPQASLCTTDGVSALIEELQFTLGEGPSVDAYRTGAVVTEGDLVNPSAARWPAFAARVVRDGVRAIFAFPIHLGATRLGALSLYRNESGPLSDEQQADALVMADVIARTLLALQADSRPGAIPVQLDTQLYTVVHQAAGMLSAELDLSVGDALVRLRAEAFRTDRPVAEVARQVIERRFDWHAEEL